MKNKILIPIILLILGISSTNLCAQAPESIIYQAEARDAKGGIIKNTTLEVKFIILEVDPAIVIDPNNLPPGYPVWDRVYEVTTDEYGLFSVAIGSEGIDGVTDLSGVDWHLMQHLLNVQVYDKGAWVNMGTTQFLSVPYALHAKTVSSAGETDPVFKASSAFLISSGQVFSWDDAFDWGDHSLAGYLSSENDPIFGASAAFGITSTNISHWNTAYGWGDHSIVGYLSIENDPEVGITELNYIPKWDGTTLITSSIYDNGNIGIGTSTPTETLTLKTNGTTSFGIDRQSSGDAGWINFRTAGDMRWAIGAENTSDNLKIYSYGGGGTAMYIKYSTGDVGIGTRDPKYSLDVIGDVNLTGNIYKDGGPFEWASMDYVDNQIALLQSQITTLQAQIEALTSGLTLCSGEFVNLQTDEYNCGNCGVDCDPGYSCVNGECVLICPAGQIEINGQCIDPDIDENYCGATPGDWGTDCSLLGEICLYGECVPVCPEGFIECNGICIDISSDYANCGACDIHCGPDQICMDEVCVTVCPEGFADCDGIISNGCETDLSTNTDNCGTCGNTCSTINANTVGCSNGECEFLCDDGWGDCNEGYPSDGCETDLSTENNCGECGIICQPGYTCVNGICELVCPDGMTKCGDECVDTSSDELHCGGCNRACPAGQTCVNGVCIAPSTQGFDWRVDIPGAVSPVRNQGQCGSCWVFSTLGMVEARMNINANRNGLTMPQLDLSEQHVLVCNDANQGCTTGGNPLTSLAFVANNGVVEETCLSYDPNNSTCPASLNCDVVQIDNYESRSLPLNSTYIDEIKDEIFRHGPLVMTFDLYQNFYDYTNGIYGNSEGSFRGTVARLIVGWGTEASTDYWIVKNDWGANWGEGGYFRIDMNSDIIRLNTGYYVSD